MEGTYLEIKIQNVFTIFSKVNTFIILKSKYSIPSYQKFSTVTYFAYNNNSYATQSTKNGKNITYGNEKYVPMCVTY